MAGYTGDGFRQYTQQSPYYVQVPSPFDGPEVHRPSQPVSYARPAHPSVASLQAYYSPPFGSPLTPLSSHSSSSSASHADDYSPSPLSFDDECSPSLLSPECPSTYDLDMCDSFESISTLRPSSSVDENRHSPQHSDWEMFFNDEMGTEAPEYQLQVRNVVPESRTETLIKPRIAFIETSKTIMADSDSDSISSCVVTETEIQQWKYIRFPTSPKTKPTNFEPEQSSVLSLTARISCTKKPSISIPCCKSCQGREARKSQKKLSKLRASIPSALSGGSTIAEGANQGLPYVSPLEFNGDELIPLTNGAVDLSFRITCYCSHHDEPEGFLVQFTLTDYLGRVVGEATTSPIMIIDNHKSKPKLSRKIRDPDNANGMPKSPAQGVTVPSGASQWITGADDPTLITRSTPIHHFEPTSTPFDEYLGFHTSGNFQVTNPQGQTMRSNPRITRATPDSGYMRSGTHISTNDQTFGSFPWSTRFDDQVTHVTVDRASVPGAIASENSVAMNHGERNSHWNLALNSFPGSWW